MNNSVQLPDLLKALFLFFMSYKIDFDEINFLFFCF